jgi:CMP-N-acetylneuraminic acid synthetase
MKYIIPARKGSKGLKNKNRLLFKHTADSIPPEKAKDVYVTTDDDWIIEKSKEYGFNHIRRTDELSHDDVSIRHVLEDLVLKTGISDDITMMYLTYPRRTWEDICNFERFYKAHDSVPAVCKKDVNNHPFLCYYNIDGNKGKKLVEHNLYRRQDYPLCFEICHFLFASHVNDLPKLDLNLFCEDTVFYHIESDKCLDVDTGPDYDRFMDGLSEENKDNS